MSCKTVKRKSLGAILLGFLLLGMTGTATAELTQDTNISTSTSPAYAEISPDGERIAYLEDGSNANLVVLDATDYSVISNSTIGTVSASTNEVFLSWDSDSETIGVAYKEGVSVRNTTDGSEIYSLSTSYGVSSMEFGTSTDIIYYSGTGTDGEPFIAKHDISTDTELWRNNLTQELDYPINFMDKGYVNGTTHIAGGNPDKLYAFDSSGNQIVNSTTVGVSGGISFSDSGDQIAFSDNTDLEVYDTSSSGYTPYETVSTNIGTITRSDWSNNLFAVGKENGVGYIYDASTWNQVKSFEWNTTDTNTNQIATTVYDGSSSNDMLVYGGNTNTLVVETETSEIQVNNTEITGIIQPLANTVGEDLLQMRFEMEEVVPPEDVNEWRVKTEIVEDGTVLDTVTKEYGADQGADNFRIIVSERVPEFAEGTNVDIQVQEVELNTTQATGYDKQFDQVTGDLSDSTVKAVPKVTDDFGSPQVQDGDRFFTNGEYSLYVHDADNYGTVDVTLETRNSSGTISSLTKTGYIDGEQFLASFDGSENHEIIATVKGEAHGQTEINVSHTPVQATYTHLSPDLTDGEIVVNEGENITLEGKINYNPELAGETAEIRTEWSGANTKNKYSQVNLDNSGETNFSAEISGWTDGETVSLSYSDFEIQGGDDTFSIQKESKKIDQFNVRENIQPSLQTPTLLLNADGSHTLNIKINDDESSLIEYRPQKSEVTNFNDSEIKAEITDVFSWGGIEVEDEYGLISPSKNVQVEVTDTGWTVEDVSISSQTFARNITVQNTGDAVEAGIGTAPTQPSTKETVISSPGDSVETVTDSKKFQYKTQTDAFNVSQGTPQPKTQDTLTIDGVFNAERTLDIENKESLKGFTGVDTTPAVELPYQECFITSAPTVDVGAQSSVQGTAEFECDVGETSDLFQTQDDSDYKEYQKTLSIYGDLVKENPLEFTVQKDNLAEFEYAEGLTVKVDGQEANVSVVEEADKLFVVVGDDFGNSSLEPGTHTATISYDVQYKSSSGTETEPATGEVTYSDTQIGQVQPGETKVLSFVMQNGVNKDNQVDFRVPTEREVEECGVMRLKGEGGEFHRIVSHSIGEGNAKRIDVQVQMPEDAQLGDEYSCDVTASPEKGDSEDLKLQVNTGSQGLATGQFFADSFGGASSSITGFFEAILSFLPFF